MEKEQCKWNNTTVDVTEYNVQCKKNYISLEKYVCVKGGNAALTCGWPLPGSWTGDLCCCLIIFREGRSWPAGTDTRQRAYTHINTYFWCYFSLSFSLSPTHTWWNKVIVLFLPVICSYPSFCDSLAGKSPHTRLPLHVLSAEDTHICSAALSNVFAFVCIPFKFLLDIGLVISADNLFLCNQLCEFTCFFFCALQSVEGGNIW